MRVTLEQITERQDRLELEIVEREAVLAAVLAPAMLDLPPIELADAEALRSAWSMRSLELGSHVSALPSPEPISATEAVPAPPAAALPAPPPVKAYMHPELRAMGNHHGSDSQRVRWAIRRMTADYTMRDLLALLKREGHPMFSDQVSVVLTRLRSNGEIEEVERGRGPIPSVFRKPENASANETNIPGSELESTVESAVAS